MSIAQKLYENGKITYMRTDSPTISPEFQSQLCSHIGETWSPEYYQPSITGKKVKGAAKKPSVSMDEAVFLAQTAYDVLQNDESMTEMVKRIRKERKKKQLTQLMTSWAETSVDHWSNLLFGRGIVNAD